MKGKFILLISVIVIALLSIIIILNKKEITSDYLIDISYNEYIKKVSNEDSFILYVKQTNCSHCINFTPIIKNVAEHYKVNVYVLNFSNITEEEYNQFKDELGVSGTPTVLFFENGTELGKLSRISGEKSKEYVIDKFTKRGYIKNTSN